MNTQKSSKTAYIIIGIIVIIGVMIYFYVSGSSTTDTTTLEQVDGSQQEVGAEVFKLLGEINSLHIDRTFFEGSDYRNLKDFTVEIPSVPIGRQNPFAPVPGVSLTTGNTR